MYLPVEDPTSDLYGGHRPGDNLFGDSIVCVDLKTGQRKWHFQIVHHPIWDLDMPAAPLADGHQRRRQADQGGRAGRRSRVSCSCSIAITGQAGLADRRAPGAADRRARREDQPDAALPDQAAGLLAERRARERSRRLHARDQGAGARSREALPARARLSATARQQGRRAARGADVRHVERRRELARLGVRPGDACLLLACVQRVHRAARPREAASGVLGLSTT